MVNFLTSQFMIGVYFYLSGCILAKRMLVWYGINDPEDKYAWVTSWVLVLILIIRGRR